MNLARYKNLDPKMVELWFIPLLGINFKFQLNWDW